MSKPNKSTYKESSTQFVTEMELSKIIPICRKSLSTHRASLPHYVIGGKVFYDLAEVLEATRQTPELVSPAPDSNSDRGEGDSVVNERAASVA